MDGERTSVKEALLRDLDSKASQLKGENGYDGAKMAELMSAMSHVLVAMARNAGPTAHECEAFRTDFAAAVKKGGDWRRSLAIMVPACATLFGLVKMIVG